ncbi:MAG: DUF7507 domain-containing protein, partial [Cellulomonadaceae bacterium]
MVTFPAVPAFAADEGSTLTNETFTGDSVADGRWLPLGDACLTATANGSTPPAAASALGYCERRNDSPTTDDEGKGYLQLTDNEGGRTGAVLFNRAIPSHAGLEIEFDQYQYKPDSGQPADGIGFFLTDGAYTLTKTGPMGGNVGGALGYGSIEKEPGIDQGYLAVGLDRFGNFANQPYVGTSCPAQTEGQQPNSVVLRGSGNGTDGYCIVDENNDVSLGGNSVESGERHVKIVISPTTDANARPTVTVYVDGNEVLQGTMNQDLPPTVKLGFTASTGGAREVHLVRMLTVKTIESLGDINLVKSVDHSDESGTQKTVFTAGDTVPYSFVVTNTGEETLTGVEVTDPKIKNIVCPADTLDPQDSFVCTGSYGPLTDDEATAGSFTNTARVDGETPDGDPVTDNSTVVIPTYTTGNFSVVKKVEGSGATEVPADAQFTVDYAYPAGDYVPASSNASGQPNGYPAGSGTLTVTNNGEAVTSGVIPTGAQVALTEGTAPAVDGADWSSGTFDPTGVTIGAQASTVPVTLTNVYDRIPGQVSWTKVDGDGALLAGSEWSLAGPGGTTIPVVDNGTNDADPADGSFLVTDLAWGTYTLTETKAPAGYLVGQFDVPPFTIDATHTTVALNAVENTKAVPGLVVKKSSDPASGERVKPGQTITYTVVASNTGNVDLTGVVVSDDLADVLDNAGFVDGSAKAVVGGESVADPVVGGAELLWSGDLAVGDAVTITYQVTVNADVTQDDALVNVVVADGETPPGVPPVVPNCTPGSADPDCSTNHTPNEAGLVVKKSSDPASGARVNPGDTITYTVVASNAGNVDLTGVVVSDDLADVLDNAGFVDGSAKAVVGGESVADPVVGGAELLWSGDLAVGDAVTITYQVTVNADVTQDDALVNVVVADGVRCPLLLGQWPQCRIGV